MELPRLARGDVDAGRLFAETGHPNTYTLTKGVAEHLLAQRAGDLPLTLVLLPLRRAYDLRAFITWFDHVAARQMGSG